jgi:hypothetical protein
MTEKQPKYGRHQISELNNLRKIQQRLTPRQILLGQDG